MEEKIWFIINEGQVTGPYSQTEAETKISTAKDPQIWGRGHGEWMPVSRWRQNLKNLPKKSSVDEKQQTKWKIRFEGKEINPLNYSELISFLKTQTDLTLIDICPEQNTQWKEVYAFPEIVDAIGICRRSHPRVPIVGKLVCKGPQGELTCRVISISEGGLGINDAKNMKMGERFKATLTSPNLLITINCECEIIYVGSDGYAGLRFIRLPTEFKSSLIEYINKFATA
ncbi:MAG: PilZ domain-containing protein [Bdellovibrio sp.]